MRWVSLITVVFACLPLAGSASESGPTPVMIGYRTGFASQVLGEDRDLLISLPANYEQRSESFPVLLVLDGLANFQHAAATAEFLARTGHGPEMIVVGVPNTDRTRDFTVNRHEDRRRPTGGAEAFLDCLEDELLPLVDRSFRTHPYRVLVGHSLGGSLALYAAATRPGLFDAMIVVSPAISMDERAADDDEAAMTGRVAAGLEAQDTARMRLFVTMSAGEDPEWVEDWRKLRRVLRRRAPEGLKWRERELPEDDHGTAPLASVHRGLRWIFEGWRGTEAAAGGDLQSLEEHFAALSERVGYPVRPREELLNALGYRLLSAGETGPALAVFRRTLELYPESANAHDSLGEGLEQAGRLEEAAKAYRRALELAGDLPAEFRAAFARHLERVEETLAAGE